jgi:hypothetical protein
VHTDYLQWFVACALTVLVGSSKPVRSEPDAIATNAGW